MEGKCFDSLGNLRYVIEGSWLEEVRLRDVLKNKVEVLWQDPPMMPDAHLQYFFNRTSVIMNYKNEAMAQKISPTDSRMRPDIRLYEEGQADEADAVKFEIEEQQRRTRRKMEAGQATWQPFFFEEVKHPFITSKTFKHTKIENPVLWRVKESSGDFKSYWDRREAGDWRGMPNLWGPFDQD